MQCKRHGDWLRRAERCVVVYLFWKDFLTTSFLLATVSEAAEPAGRLQSVTSQYHSQRRTETVALCCLSVPLHVMHIFSFYVNICGECQHQFPSNSCTAGGKCRKVFESALGRVLFIDEAYRCAVALHSMRLQGI